jgi:hypothetical protein
MNEYAIRILVTQMYVDAELVDGESRVNQLQFAIDILQGEVIAEGRIIRFDGNDEPFITAGKSHGIDLDGIRQLIWDAIKKYENRNQKVRISISKIKE